jgi:hypothetical protein
MATSPERPIEEDRDRGSGRRTVGFIAAGVGIAALATGVSAGLVYLGKRDDYNSCRKLGGNDADVAAPCADPNAPGSAAAAASYDADLRSSAHTLGVVSTIGFAIGVVGLAAGGYLLLTSKTPGHAQTGKTASTAAQLRFVPSSSGGAIIGTF